MTVFEGFELLDLSGPASVFSTANFVLDAEAYRVAAVSCGGGLVASSSGIAIDTRDAARTRVRDGDTVLVSGGSLEGLRVALEDENLRQWIARGSARAARYGSICAGAMLLARTGCLDGLLATTHWAAAEHVARDNPKVRLQTDALYVHDGRAWTSAGVATGIDMALAMVEADHGVTAMGAVAKQLVVYARRPGNQSQYSPVLDAQVAAADDLRDLVAWIDAHLGDDLVVADLAARVGMSERSFYRHFTKSMGQTPAKYIEEARMERAKGLLEAGASISDVSETVGYRSTASFRRAFANRFGVSPSFHRRMAAR